jgi:catechol 2,3-dioxygenase-like lactoylglutathione lyase family enzyme
MAKVLGIGGVFFKAADPAALGAWYARVLGLEVRDWGGVMFQPTGEAPQVWSPFAADTGYFAPSQHPFMINLMVDDLDGVLARAKAEGVEPLDRKDEGTMGQFAWLMDPGGLKVELWQPAVEDAPAS